MPPKSADEWLLRGRFAAISLLNEEFVFLFLCTGGFHFLGCNFYHERIDFPGVIGTDVDASHAGYASVFVGLFGIVQGDRSHRACVRAKTAACAFPYGLWL